MARPVQSRLAMRHALLVSSVLLMACGANDGETPTPEELIGEAAFAAKGGDGNGHGHDQGGQGWFKGHHSKEFGDRRRCENRMEDPFADDMPRWGLRESFERDPLGSLDEEYGWFTTPGATFGVTEEQAHHGKRSLKVTAPATRGYHTVGARFCVRCEAMERFNVDLAIRFESFASWTGLMVTNNPDYAYWWWVRSDGTVFENATFAQLKPKTWHKVQIAIDRKRGTGTITIDGAPHTMPLAGTWYDLAASQPMGCFRVLLLSKEAQTLYLDKIRIHGLR